MILAIVCSVVVLSLTNEFADAGFAQDALSAHNSYRSKCGASGLRLDSTLTSVAQAYANTLASSDVMQHSNNPNYGENLYQAFDSSPPASAAVKMWYDEKSVYPGGEPNTAGILKWGHYTQLCWKETTKVGCAVSGRSASGAYYVVCNYDPPGNTEGEFAANV